MSVDYSFYESINSPDFVALIETLGPGGGRLGLPRNFQKWRMAPDGVRNVNVTPASAVVIREGDQLVIRWKRINSGPPGILNGWVEVDAARHFAYLHFVAPIDGKYYSWPIEKLRGGVENDGTSSVAVGQGPDRWVTPEGRTYQDVIEVIYKGKIDSPVQDRANEGVGYRPKAGDQCGFWVGGWDGGTERRTDILPWTWGPLAGSQPPDDREPAPDPPGDDRPPQSRTGRFEGNVSGAIVFDE